MAQPDLVNARMGGTLVPGGATFRLWAPRATAVYVSGDFNGWRQDASATLAPIGGGHWASFVPGLKDGDPYLFYVDGPGSRGYKRDPRARLLSAVPDFPASNSILRAPQQFPWHETGFRPPAFNDLVIYQLHIGTFSIAPGRANGTFLDAIARVPYLAELGVNAIQLLPIQEFPTAFSLGYNGTDFYSPENEYSETDNAGLQAGFEAANAILGDAGQTPYSSIDILRSADDQLRALIDVCHVHGIAVLFDLVYNHAGGGFDDQSLWFLDRMAQGNQNDSLYFTDQGWAGGLVFAYWNADVRAFLIGNARFFYEEYRVDGFRFDEVSVMDRFGGWLTCQDLTDTLRATKPEAILIAEYWPVNESVVSPRASGGAGFDATWSDSLRESVRTAIGAASTGASAHVSMNAIADALEAVTLTDRWRAVQMLEDHDIVYAGRSPRVAALADGADARSWYARSRSRVAMGLLLTAPGIPMLFMGQEFLESKPWSDTPSASTSLDWAMLDSADKVTIDFVHFTRDLIRLRRERPALRAEGCRVIHVHDDNRVIAVQRWIDGVGDDVVVVASVNEQTWYGYEIGFPVSGWWREVFNSDVYDDWVNPVVAGNGGGVTASGPAMHGLPCSATVVIPANGFVVFSRS